MLANGWLDCHLVINPQSLALSRISLFLGGDPAV